MIFSDNSVQDPATNKSWTLRRPRVEKKAEGEDSSGNTTERGSALINLITYKLNGLDKPGKVSAAFGWPSYQSHSQDGRTRTDTYPLKRPGSPNAFLLVTSKAISDQFEVVSMAMKWIGGMPKTPQELRIKFGEPDQVFGSVASGFQKFVYNYQLSTEPFIVGHPKKFRYGISIVFSIRSGVKLLDEVEIKKITY